MEEYLSTNGGEQNEKCAHYCAPLESILILLNYSLKQAARWGTTCRQKTTAPEEPPVYRKKIKKNRLQPSLLLITCRNPESIPTTGAIVYNIVSFIVLGFGVPASLQIQQLNFSKLDRVRLTL